MDSSRYGGEAMRKLALFCLLLAACGSSAPPASGGYGPFYTVSGGSTISLHINPTRTTGISPLTVWYDATTSTDSAVTTPYMDLTCVWNFGDTGASGTGTWSTGNQSFNSMNAGRGLIAAHTYVVPDGSGDKTYTASVTCHDVSGNSATANATQITVYDPSGANGFPTTATTCVFNTTVGTGCPSGATTLTTSALATPLAAPYFGSGKRVLFKCGDSWSGQFVVLPSATKFSVGAYGSCVGTKTGRPKWVANGTGTYPDNGIVFLGDGSSIINQDGRFSDIECDGNTFNNNGCVTQPYVQGGHVVSQITMYNLACVGCYGDFAWQGGNQMALVWSSKDNAQEIGTFINSGSYTNSSSWITTNCPDGTKVSCLDYQALIGNDLQAPSLVGTTPGSGIENTRISGGRYIVVTNNWIRDASTNGPILKMHCTDGLQGSAWQGDLPYCAYLEIADNHIGKHITTEDGGLLADIAPQDGGSDERWNYVMLEDNFFDGAVPGSRSVAYSGQNMVARDNIWWMDGNDLGIQIWTKGSIQTSTFPTTNVQVYNNTFYDPAFVSTSAGIFTGDGHGSGGTAAQNPTNVTVKNNLCFGAAGTCASDAGGNTLSNNTATITLNPGFTNGSTTLSVETDYKPTANYTGGATVSVYTDILGIVWPPTWDLGAVHH